MKTSNQLKQQLGFNVPRFHVWLCPNHVCVQPRSPQTVWVGGGSNCFPLVGTREIGFSWMIKFWTLVLTLVLIVTFSGFIPVDMSSLSTEFIDACARQLGGKRLQVKFSWEDSQFEQFLSKKPRQILIAPDWIDLPEDDAVRRDVVPKPTRLNKFNVKRHMSEVSWVASENHRLNLALQCWKVIVLDSTSNTDPGKLLMQCIEHGKSDDYIWQVINDAFSSRAAATLKSRAASLLAFGRWKRSISWGASESIFPITEEMAYEYLCELRALKAAPTKGRRFLEAVGFAKGLIGAKVDEVLSSARVKGAAAGASTSPPKKKWPFSVEQLIILERIAIFGHGQDSIFAGYLCFLVHCRLRWSDGQHCIQEPVLDIHNNKGFLEAALYHHKTANKRRSKVVRLLPVAAVVPGISGYNWAKHWLQKRIDMKLRGSLQQPMMPAPTADGTWSQQPLTSSEASVWLRELLGPWTPSSIQKLATHSAKATILSWLAKANVDISLRRLAGYHVTPGDKSALEYSRDAAAPVLRQIEALFIAVRAEIFQPDLPRSQRWSGAHSLDDAVKLAAVHLNANHSLNVRKPYFSASLFDLEASEMDDAESGPHESESFQMSCNFHDETTLDELKRHTLETGFEQTFSFESGDVSDVSDAAESAESSTDSDSQSDDMERQAVLNGEKNAKDLVPPSDLAGKTCFKHVKSHKLHFVERCKDGVMIFRCGRRCNDNYVKLATVPAFAARGCMTCFGWSDKIDDEVGSPDE